MRNCLIALVLLAGCIETSLRTVPAEPGSVCCGITVTETLPGPSVVAQAGEEVGDRVGLAASGPSPSTIDSERFVVVRSGVDDFERRSSVMLFGVGPTDGELVSGAPIQVLEPPSSITLRTFSRSRDRSFGRSILLADIIECHDPDDDGADYQGCGDEILVSAAPPPGMYSHEGVVYIFVRDGSVTDLSPGSLPYKYHSFISLPEVNASSPSQVCSVGDEFGGFMAAAELLRDSGNNAQDLRPFVDPSEPFRQSPNYPDVIYVHAPSLYNSGGTYLLPVDPSNHASPLGTPTRVTNYDEIYALHAGDFVRVERKANHDFECGDARDQSTVDGQCRLVRGSPRRILGRS